MSTPKMDIVLLDNMDSFTYNLVDQFRALGYPVTVFRHHLDADAIVSHIRALPQPLLVLSPGPGAPADAGCMPALIEALRGHVPMLGICLGQQAIVEAYGGTVAGAGTIMHGKASAMHHQQHAVFGPLASPLTVARYHSLVATDVPANLDVIATTFDGKDQKVMAVVNNTDYVVGYQFHPESILTAQGAALLTHTIDWASEFYQGTRD